MAQPRRLALTLLVLLGLLSTLGWTTGAPAGSLREEASQAAKHHQHQAPRAPLSGDMPVCGVCMAVLPPIAMIELRPLMPLVPLIARLLPLSGMAPALDPPPPRAG
jgi:hypothetical protein